MSILCWSGRRIDNGKVEIGARQEKTHNAYEGGFTVNRYKHVHQGRVVFMLPGGQVCLDWKKISKSISEKAFFNIFENLG